MPYLPRLKQVREERALTQRQLADLAGISRGRLLDLEREDHPAKARGTTHARLAAALGVDPKLLMDGHYENGNA